MKMSKVIFDAYSRDGIIDDSTEPTKVNTPQTAVKRQEQATWLRYLVATIVTATLVIIAVQILNR